jgi:hypothetical protein
MLSKKLTSAWTLSGDNYYDARSFSPLSEETIQRRQGVGLTELTKEDTSILRRNAQSQRHFGKIVNAWIWPSAVT